MTKIPEAHISVPGFCLVSFLFASMILIGGCGYSFELSKLDEAEPEDPITLIRRELRRVKADNRVALFDLRQEQKNQLSSMQANLLRIEKANQETAERLAQFERDIRAMESSLGQKNADVDERFAEMERQHRLIHGRIEEEANRIQEVSSRANDFSLKELSSVRKAMTRQDDSQKKLQKTFQNQLALLKSQEGQDVKEVSDQVSQLIEKVVPAVNGITTRLDNLEWQLKQLDNDIDSDALKRRLTDLSEAVDVQRQSLEMLGNTLSSQVDRQQGLLKKVSDRLKSLETSLSSKPK